MFHTLTKNLVPGPSLLGLIGVAHTDMDFLSRENSMVKSFLYPD